MQNIAYAILIPTIIVLAISFMSRNTKALLVNNFGLESQYYLGMLGIVIHESSHALVALLFHHQIKSFRPLINPRTHPETDALGYVQQEWDNRSLYQRFGNLFISIAPIFGCSLVLYLILKLALPNLYQLMLQLREVHLQNFWTKIESLLSETHLFTNSSLSSNFITLIALLALLSIVLGGFDLSNADLENAERPFLHLCIFFLIIFALAPLLKIDVIINACLLKFVKIFISIFSIPFLIDLAINLILKIINLIG